MEAVAPLANDPIMSGRSIQSFRHLEHQNPSIISDSIGRARMAARKREKKLGGVGGNLIHLEEDIYALILKTIAHRKKGN